MIDFATATTELARVVAGVRDDQLSLPTPCPGWDVADLVDHVQGCARGFTAAARKQDLDDDPPEPDGTNLDAGWREAIAAELETLAAAWRDGDAWEGRTRIAGVEQSGAECAATALDEVVVHTWDLARATGQDCSLDPAAVAGALAFARAVSQQAPDGVPGLFGPAVEVPSDADAETALLALTGRDPGWSATAG
ncbi:TIGR03086 family protein [Marmoricola endophyticus]|uniref:TIGR03086 family protein n=1 Tax=Marmoricola endophyticus TaxID=2040280 RepID=A0A917F320_9ACTN|nr:TIGR03086 family metal-binding protein [Marmoricola endophyticus]GGF38285.1 TIGR03086 family protein [Marmoricola endophyticus]